MTVMLGGSRNLNQLPQEVSLRIQTWIDKEVDFVLGDASGIDTVFQAWFRRLSYGNVRVFTSAPEVRNNLGNWSVVKVDSGLKSRGSAMHSVKDRHMSLIADVGLMMWDGESPGTLANVLDLARQNKDAYLYVAPEKELRCFVAGLGVDDLAQGYPEPFAIAEKRLRQFAKRQAKDSQQECSGRLFDDSL